MLIVLVLTQGVIRVSDEMFTQCGRQQPNKEAYGKSRRQSQGDLKSAECQQYRALSKQAGAYFCCMLALLLYPSPSIPHMRKGARAFLHPPKQQVWEAKRQDSRGKRLRGDRGRHESGQMSSKQ